eukprot:COSAG01_NODE_73792_length_236_cov_5.489051_1_plen_28_part_01
MEQQGAGHVQQPYARPAAIREAQPQRSL